MALRYRRGFITAVKAVCHYVRYICRESERAERFRWKLFMLRNAAWREAVFKELGGEQAMQRWYNQPPKEDPRFAHIEKIAKRLSPLTLARRAHMRFCAKACQPPHILRDPCRLDQEGLFRLPPIRKLRPFIPVPANVFLSEYSYDPTPLYKCKFLSSPITVWPDEFQVFAEIDKEAEEARVKRRERFKVLFLTTYRQAYERHVRVKIPFVMQSQNGVGLKTVFLPP